MDLPPFQFRDSGFASIFELHRLHLAGAVPDDLGDSFFCSDVTVDDFDAGDHFEEGALHFCRTASTD